MKQTESGNCLVVSARCPDRVAMQALTPHPTHHKTGRVTQHINTRTYSKQDENMNQSLTINMRDRVVKQQQPKKIEPAWYDKRWWDRLFQLLRTTVHTPRISCDIYINTQMILTPITTIRPFLTQSDSAVAIYDRTFFRLDSSGPCSYRQSGRFRSFCALPEAVGVSGYCCTAVWKSKIGWQLCASRVVREQRVLALDEPSSQRVGGFRLIAESYLRGVALSREPRKLQQAQPLLAKWNRYRTLLPSCDKPRCWRAELRMRHADLRREITVVIVKPASAPCMILCCVEGGCVGVWVFGGGMSDAMG